MIVDKDVLFGLTPEYCGKRPPEQWELWEGKNPWSRTISTVLWVHKKLPQSTVKLVLPSNESYESKTGCNRTLATVLWVPMLYFWKMSSSNLFEDLIFLLACSVHFVRRRFWAISTESQRSCPNRLRTRCTEHTRQKIRPSKRLELYIFQSIINAADLGSRSCDDLRDVALIKFSDHF